MNTEQTAKKLEEILALSESLNKAAPTVFSHVKLFAILALQLDTMNTTLKSIDDRLKRIEEEPARAAAARAAAGPG